MQYENTASHTEWQINLLTILRPMDFFIKFDTVMPGWSIEYIEGSQVVISKNSGRVLDSKPRGCVVVLEQDTFILA